MSLEDVGTSKKVRRTTRGQRNRPTLVTSNYEEVSSETSAPNTGDLAIDSAEETMQAESKPEPRPRRLPNFFPTIGKSEEDSKAKEAEVAQARLARATRGKAVQVDKKTSTKEGTKTESKVARPAAASSKAPAKPASPFKTRYIIGIALYLLTANFIGVLEKSLLQSAGMERLLTTFNLFGSSIQVTTSTLFFLATLILVLVILARLDLIPRSLGAMSGSSSPSAQSQKASQSTTEGSRQIPPPVKQGVKGADDKLYQEYRNNQRREKKR